MYSSKISELLEANKVSMATDNSIEPKKCINGVGYYKRDANTKNVGDDDLEELGNDAIHNEDVGGVTDQVYLNKLSTLKSQLKHLHDGTHKEYNRKKKDIIGQYNDRIKMNEEWRDFQMAMVEKEYENETRLAVEEFEEKKTELKENLVLEFEDKKRLIEQERFSLDLSGDSMEYKPVSTRKLRRRGNEPQPVVEKRRKTIANSLDAVLEDHEIEDDIRKMYKNKLMHVKRSKPPLDFQEDNNSNGRKQRLSGPSIATSFRHPSPSSSPSYSGNKNDGHVLTRSGTSRTIR